MPRGILLGLVTLIVVSFLTVVLSAGMAPGAVRISSSSEPLFLGFQTIFGRGLKTRVAGAYCLRRPDRQLPHDHICLRPADLFALARRIFSYLALGDARHAGNAAARPAFGECAGIRGCPGHTPHAARQPRGRGAAEYGGLRRGDRVYPANGVLHRAAAALPADGAAVPESGGNCGRCAGARRGGGDAGHARS